MAREKYSLDMPNILVVDDVADNCDLIYNYVTTFEKVNVVTATTGWQAIEYYRKYEFALMLIDVDMPKMDGFELVREMKNIKTTDLTPIIYITGYDKNSKRATVGYDLGAVDYILKPFDMEFLLTKVRVFLKLYHQRKLLESEIASKSASQNVLIESNSMVNNLISESYSFVCSFDIKGKIESINLPSIDLLKAEKLGNILGMQFSKWVFNKDTPIFLEGLGKAAKGIQTEIKIRMQSTENDIIWLQLKILPKIKNEIIETIYCLGNDVSRSVFDETDSENSK